jgi:protein-disulfide isomerase
VSVVSSREQRKQAAREARLAAERREASAALRRRRLSQLGGMVLAAATVVAVLVAVSSGGGSGHKAVPSGGAAADAGNAPALLGGLPQSGLTLGKRNAPVTLVEFNDMQCPICRQYTSAVFPSLVAQYVRTGKLRMEMRLQSFIGPGSVTAGRAVAAAAKQNRAWTFADIFYDNQQQENSGYVTPDFLSSIAAATPGLNNAKLGRDTAAPASAQALTSGTAAFDASGFSGTPSFLIGRTGGPLKPLNFSALTPSQFSGPIEQLLA